MSKQIIDQVYKWFSGRSVNNYARPDFQFTD